MTQHSHHVSSVRTYLLVFASLLILTGATVGAAYLDLGVWNDIIALAIAVTKAVLIILWFMHVRYSDGLTRVVVVAGWLWLIMLILGVLDDVLTRSWRFVPGP